MSDIIPLIRPILIAGALFLSVAAYAQAFIGGDHPPPATDRPLPPLPSEHVEARIAYMKTALAPTPAQTPLWDRFAEALRTQGKRRDAVYRIRQSAQEIPGKNVQSVVKSNLIDEIESVQREMSAESDDLAELLAALKPLYATLTDQQKIIADEIVRPGPGGPLEFGPPGTEMRMIDHRPMRPPPCGRDCEPDAQP